MLSLWASFAFEHVGDNFHIVVRMHAKAAAGRHAVVVNHAQAAEMHMLRIVVVRERKGEVRIEPAVVGVSAFLGGTDGDHWVPPSNPDYKDIRYFNVKIVSNGVKGRKTRGQNGQVRPPIVTWRSEKP